MSADLLRATLLTGSCDSLNHERHGKEASNYSAPFRPLHDSGEVAKERRLPSATMTVIGAAQDHHGCGTSCESQTSDEARSFFAN